MEHLIDKSALVAEIEKLQSEIAEEKKLHEDNSMWYNGINHGFNLTKDILNTLEMKEVDLHLAYHDFLESHRNTGYMLFEVAEYFFELGLKAQHDKVKEVDLELITGWFDHIAQIADDRMTLTNQRMTDSHALDEIKCIAKNSSEFITKHYKAQKGEEV